MPTCLLDRVKLDAKKSSSRENLTKNQCININENKALSGDVYSNMCSSGCLVQFPEYEVVQVLSFNTSINLKGGAWVSAMNLIVTPLRTNLNQANMNRFMRILINGPDYFTYTQMKQLVDKYKNDDKRCISL